MEVFAGAELMQRINLLSLSITANAPRVRKENPRQVPHWQVPVSVTVNFLHLFTFSFVAKSVSDTRKGCGHLLLTYCGV